MTPDASSTASVARTVSQADTATAWGAEFPPAASTPFVLGLAEVACHRAVASGLGHEEITVGTSAAIEHVAASPVGATLVASARLVDRSGRRLAFEVEVNDGPNVIATITHVRAIVERAWIVGKLEAS